MDKNCSHYFDAFSQTPGGDFKTEYYNPFVVRHRKKTTKSQLMILEQTFENNVRPDARTRRILSEQLQMTPRSIQVWFQNRRAKEKKMAEKKFDCGLKSGEFSFSVTNNSLYTPPWHKETQLMIQESEDEISEEIRLPSYYKKRTAL